MEHELMPVDSLVAEIELSYTPLIKPSLRPQVTRTEDAYALFVSTWDKSKIGFVEQFKVMVLNKANRVLGICTLSTGSPTQTIADPKQVFVVALKANATAIILCHNHPSGHVSPSTADVELTHRMKKAAAFLDMSLLDHLIISTDAYYSFAGEGTL